MKIEPRRIAYYTGLIVNFFLLIIALFFAVPYDKSFLAISNPSLKIFDRNNYLLAEFTPEIAGFSSKFTLSEMPTNFIKLLLFSEDRDFETHPGFSLKSVARVIYLLFSQGQAPSGASTISQQLAKLKYGINRNNFITKILELFRALKIESYFNKHEILESYLNNVFLGNHVYGIKKAAEVYFSKDMTGLTLLEMASMIEIIKAPSAYDPYKQTSLVEAKAKNLLARAYTNGIIDMGELTVNLDDHLIIYPYRAEINAPHFCFWVLENVKKMIPNPSDIAEIHTTLDLTLYNQIQAIAKDRMVYLKQKNANHVSILMTDNKSGDILVMLGSVDFFSEDGQINGVTMKRQPGSTMKPFNYALALESKNFTPATILPDIYSEFPSMVGKYVPKNYDWRYHGPVRVAMALGCSYNVPAVYILSRTGLYPYYMFLKNAGFDSLDRPLEFYGLGLTLGNADLSLYELVRGYMIFPNNGVYADLNGIRYIVMKDQSTNFPKPKEEKRVLSPESAFLINHILSEYKYKTPAFGVNSPINFPFPVAVKTGTSKDYRDNFLVGYNPQFTIGIWTGNFSGAPMKNLPSASGGGVILRDLILHRYKQGWNLDQPFSSDGMNITKAAVCKLSGMLAGPECDSDVEYFIYGTEPKDVCTWHLHGKVVIPEIYEDWARKNLPEWMIEVSFTTDLKIVSPSDGDIYRIDHNVAIENQAIELKALAKSDDVVWFVDGLQYGAGKKLLWMLRTGEHRIKAVAGEFEKTVSIIVVE
jgi:penicillin-binding protein 1C